MRDLRDLRDLRDFRDLRDLCPPLRDLREPLRPLRDLRLALRLRLRPPVNPGSDNFPPEGKMLARGFLRPPLFTDLRRVLRPVLRDLRDLRPTLRDPLRDLRPPLRDFLDTLRDFLDFLDLRLTFLDLCLRPPVIPGTTSLKDIGSEELFFLEKNIFYILTQQKN